MPSANSSYRPAGGLQAALKLNDDKQAFSIFASDIRRICLTKLDLSVSSWGNVIPPQVLQNLIEEVYLFVLLETSPLRQALEEYMIYQHKQNRACAAKVKKNAHALNKGSSNSPSSPIAAGSPQASVSKRKYEADVSPSVSVSDAESARLFKRMKAELIPMPLNFLTEEEESVPSSSQSSKASTSKSPDRQGASSSCRINKDAPVEKPLVITPRSKPLRKLGPIDLAAIDEFLQAAQPPLTHLQSHFVDAGLHTEEDLMSLAEWEDKEIVDFFVVSSRQFEMKNLTTFDIFRLKKHLKEYFVNNSVGV
ncbi:hypothetical protein CVT24_000093 [Panaeolus cyanescens]|uniref:Uncharacterized protein n=1 Tax=Panaeolus cyanescens TaxID=181874 RepID=A0A409VS00_9AGAR|nr:hypothetical protein CVT24_000093 [Panaeolus cyanescens]